MLFIVINCESKEQALAVKLERCQRIRYTELYPYVFKWGVQATEAVSTDVFKATSLVPVKVSKVGQELLFQEEGSQKLSTVSKALENILFQKSILLEMDDLSLSVEDCIEALVLIHSAIRLKKFFSA